VAYNVVICGRLFHTKLAYMLIIQAITLNAIVVKAYINYRIHRKLIHHKKW